MVLLSGTTYGQFLKCSTVKATTLLKWMHQYFWLRFCWVGFAMKNGSAVNQFTVCRQVSQINCISKYFDFFWKWPPTVIRRWIVFRDKKVKKIISISVITFLRVDQMGPFWLRSTRLAILHLIDDKQSHLVTYSGCQESVKSIVVQNFLLVGVFRNKKCQKSKIKSFVFWS
jgi:hypothetical protein